MKILGVFFLYPKWLLACALVPVLYGAGLWLMARRKERFRRFAEETVWSRIAPDLDWALPRRKLFVWCFSVLFLFLTAARPQWGETEETLKTTGLDVMIVADVSNSMLAEDVVPSRMKKAQHFMRRLLERMQGDRVGLVAFAGNALLLSPLTTDLDYVAETVDALAPDSVTAQGTDIGAGLETALNALERGAEDNSEKESQIPVSRSIVLISDGEDNEDRIGELASNLKKENLKLYVFGVGTETGGQIPIRNPDGRTVGTKRDRSGQAVLTQFRSTSLEKLAKDSGGRYWKITPSENELDELATDLGSLARGEFAEKKVTIRKERFQWPLAIALLLLVIELGIPTRKILAVTRATAFILGVSGLGLSARPVRAGEFKAYDENQKALEAFREDRISEAKDHFSRAQVENPRSSILRFNQGAIHLKEEKPADAAKVYGEAAEAAKREQIPSVAAAALYNQGVARTAEKNLEGAVESYLAALEQNAFSPQPELEAKIRKNLELLFQAQQSQSKGGESQENDPQNSDQKEKSDKSKSGKNESDGDSGEKKDEKGEDESKDRQKKIQETNGKREFKSEKLSPDDANRVMSELSRRDKDLQEKMKRMKGRPQALEKDW